MTKIRVREIKNRVPLRVLARRDLPRFGDAKVGEENVTLPSRDYVSIEHPDDQAADDADDPTLAKTLANFISKQAERGLQRDMDIIDEEFNRALPPAEETPAPKTDRYVAPGRGAGGSDSNFGFGKSADKDGTENTLRVSNLTKAVTEDDLRDLFERFGRIHRISLPRIEKPDGTKEVRGFAYIAFAHHEDAEEALNRLQGYGYDHLIIKIEWAKPTKDGEGGGGGGNRHMSGYGTKLAQDTTEKVYFNSNLTSNFGSNR